MRLPFYFKDSHVQYEKSKRKRMKRRKIVIK